MLDDGPHLFIEPVGKRWAWHALFPRKGVRAMLSGTYTYASKVSARRAGRKALALLFDCGELS